MTATKPSTVLAVLLGCAAPAAATQAPDTIRYTVVLVGNRAGTQLTWQGPDGALGVHFEFNDRGRGPVLDQRLTVDPRGVPIGVTVLGKDYFKAPVDERFVLENGRASWKSSAEEGARALDRPAFYVTLQSTAEDAAVLARALLAAPDSRLPLLPAGEARLARVGDLTVRAGGRELVVTHYAITGLGFSPFRVWLDSERRLFAQASRWLSTVREGWDSVLPDLLTEQERAQAERTRALAHALLARPAGPVALTGATLFDAPAARSLPSRTIVVRGNRVAAVGPDGSVRIPPGARVIDARGKTVLPGLWDMHVHLGDDDDALLHLAAGVTAVRDLANETEPLLERKRRFDAGEAIGPRIVHAGFMDGPGPFAGPTRVLVSTPEEVEAAVDRYATLGYEQIKMYSSIKPELVATIVASAHRRGMRVSGHIPNGMTAAEAVRLGFDEIQHANMLFLNFLSDTLDTRTPARFTAVARHAAELDLGSDSVRGFIGLLKERDVVVDPTVAIFEQMFTARPGQMPEGAALVAPRLPPQVSRGFLAGGLPVPEGMDQRYRASYRAMLGMVRALHDAGVRLVAGTDAMAGFTLHRELELYAAAGIPNAEVLRIATWGAATVARRSETLGAVAPGMLADLIVVDGDPVAAIAQIRRVELVMKDGAVYDPAAIYRELGVVPWREAERSVP